MQPLSESTPKLAERVARGLAQSIQNGSLAAGSRLPTEQSLCSQYGVSRTVVREAISMLKREELVASRQGSGTYVTPNPTIALRLNTPQANTQSVSEILEIRSALEIKAAELAAKRGDKAAIRAIRNALEELEDAVERGEDGVREDLAFHRTIVVATGNEHFVATVDFLHQLLYRAISVTRRNEAKHPPYMRQVDAEHRAILQAISSGDPQAAGLATSRHLINAEQRLRGAKALLDDS
ncbi:FadR/GntR family transcriptional regulator [Pseudomonas sp.]|uniref:FadR/GntR family transcriptional regulator n=1 Tax=Pseudomonas sp. TaxID=306 RepID=UPI003A98654D